MRTTLDLPDGLVEEAQRLLGFKSKTDTVVFALREVVRRSRIDELKNLLGTIELDVDVRDRGGARSDDRRRHRGVDRGACATRRDQRRRRCGTLLDRDEVALAAPVRVEILGRYAALGPGPGCAGCSRRCRAFLPDGGDLGLDRDLDRHRGQGGRALRRRGSPDRRARRAERLLDLVTRSRLRPARRSRSVASSSRLTSRRHPPPRPIFTGLG